MDVTGIIHVTSTISFAKRKEIYDWCRQQFGDCGHTWTYSILPGTYSYQKYDYAWQFVHEEQALQFSLTWC